MPITRAKPRTAERDRATIAAPAGPVPSGVDHRRHGGTTIAPARAWTVPQVIAHAARGPPETARARAVPTNAMASPMGLAKRRARRAKHRGPRPPS
jgi:hypothetical protein